MKFNDTVNHETHGNGVVKGFSEGGWVVYVQFPESKAMIPIPRHELKEVVK